MSNLIDSSYFSKSISIPSNTGIEKINLSINQNITDYIDIYEPEFLTTLLGSVLYAELIAGLLVDPIDAKWTNLINQLIDTTKKISPIANYIYFNYSKNEISKGQLNENPTSYNNIRSLNAWNAMVKMNKSFFDWMVLNRNGYPTFDQSFSDNFVNLFITVNEFGI